MSTSICQIVIFIVTARKPYVEANFIDEHPPSSSLFKLYDFVNEHFSPI